MRRPLLLCLALLLAGAWVRAGSTASYALNLSLQVGDKLESVLATLNERGFHIVYSSALIRPEMELRTQPNWPARTSRQILTTRNCSRCAMGPLPSARS